MESKVLRRLDFPAYCVRLLDNGLLAITGGGGTSKTGVGNSIELGFLNYAQTELTGSYEANFELIHKFETNDAIMKFVSFQFCKNEDDSPANDLYLAGALDNSIEVFRIEPCLEEKESNSNQNENIKASATIKKISHIDFSENQEETLVSLQVCRMQKSKKYENNALVCAGTSKGSILIWNIYADKNNNSNLVCKKVHEFKNAHSSSDIDGLEVNVIKINESHFEHHLLSIGKDSKCYLWSLDKFSKISELLYTKDKNLRMKHARFSTNYLYTTYVPRVRGGSKDVTSFIQRWSFSFVEEDKKSNKLSSSSSSKRIAYRPENVCCVKNTILTCMQTSKDGLFVCAGDCDGRIYLFDSHFNKLCNYKRQHSSVVTDLVFYHDELLSSDSKVLDLNKLIVSISIDRTLQLYKYISTSSNEVDRFLSKLDANAMLKNRTASSSGLLFCCLSMNLFKLSVFVLILAFLFSYFFVYVE